MSERKYNHYIPRFYFANFSGNNKYIDKCMLSSKKIIRYSSTKHTGGKEYLYGEDGGIEETFSQLEGEWDELIKTIIQNESIPNNNKEYADLLSFVLFSENRTLSKANDNLEFWGENFQVIAKLMKEHGNLDIPDYLIPLICAESPIPNLQDLRNIVLMMNICGDLQMAIIKNNSSVPFITSDNPVVKYNQFLILHKCYKPFGYGQVGIQIFFPISPQFCLVLFDPIPYRLHHYHNNKFSVNDPTTIQSINTLLAGYANQEIYFSSNTSDRTIQKILDKTKLNNLSAATGSQRFGNGYLIVKSNPSYLHRVNIPIFSLKKQFREIKLFNYSYPPLRPHAERVEAPDRDESCNDI